MSKHLHQYIAELQRILADAEADGFVPTIENNCCGCTNLTLLLDWEYVFGDKNGYQDE